ncbi:MAG TPA: MMPL family transporter [Streptosporangiaceae bacterium]
MSRDGHIAFASVQFGVPSTAICGNEVTAVMNDARAASGHGVTFSLGGDVVDQAETPYGGSSDGIGIGSGLALIALLGHVFPAPSFSPIIASMIGLGVDYALFVVTRFREFLRDGVAPRTRRPGRCRPRAGRCSPQAPPSLSA